MKKIVIAVAAIMIAVTGQAQKKNIQSASNSLRNKEYADAVKYINEAINDPSTKDDPKAWFIRGTIYSAMDQDPGYADQNHFKEAVKSYMTVVTLKPTYEEEQVKRGLMYGAYKYYNNSVIAYNNKEWVKAYENATHTVDIHGLNGGKYFAGNKGFDTVAAGAAIIQAYSAFYNNELDKAIPALESLKNNPIEGNANIYLVIADAYKQKNNAAKELATLEEARKKYPSNAEIRNAEINYYIRTGQQAELIKKLETAVAEKPDEAVYQYNLAKAYNNMAMPQDANSKPLPKPANYKDYLTKAEAGYKKAIELDPANVGYHYDMGALYFNQASEVVERMNDITGTTAEDNKKYDALKAQRDELFNKALPHLDKVYTSLEPKAKELDADNRFIYISAITAMREIYARQNKLDKAAELKAKFEETQRK